jgi:hypothetical protein
MPGFEFLLAALISALLSIAITPMMMVATICRSISVVRLCRLYGLCDKSADLTWETAALKFANHGQ